MFFRGYPAKATDSRRRVTLPELFLRKIRLKGHKDAARVQQRRGKLDKGGEPGDSPGKHDIIGLSPLASDRLRTLFCDVSAQT